MSSASGCGFPASCGPHGPTRGWFTSRGRSGDSSSPPVALRQVSRRGRPGQRVTRSVHHPPNKPPCGSWMPTSASGFGWPVVGRARKPLLVLLLGRGSGKPAIQCPGHSTTRPGVTMDPGAHVLPNVAPGAVRRRDGQLGDADGAQGGETAAGWQGARHVPVKTPTGPRSGWRRACSQLTATTASSTARVPRRRIELRTLRFSVACSTN